LLASAIAGRRVELQPAAPGEPTWTDGSTIFVDPASSPSDVLCGIAAQGSMLDAGSLDPEIATQLGRRAVSRYVALEAHRALAAHADLLPTAVRPVVDHSVGTRTDSPAASLTLARGAEPVADPPAAFGTIHPKRLRQTGDVSTHAPPTAQVGVDRATELQELDDDVEEGPSFDIFSSPVGGGGPVGRLLKRLFGDARSDRSGPPAAETATHRTRRPPGRSAAVLGTAAGSRSEEGQGDTEGLTYPEWDVHRRRFRPDWCTVIEVDEPDDGRPPLPMPDAHALRRPLARLGVELDRRHRQLQGDDIDIDAAVERIVATAAGAPPDEAVYVDSIRCRRDLSVLVLLDISGSAGEADATGRTVHEQQRAAAAMLGVTLHDLGDRVAVHGFRSQGRSAVQFVRAKRFGDDFDARVFRRMAAMHPGAYTRLGAAIRHGTSVLETHGGTARRLLVVLSDGLAYDHGYEGAYAEADARHALAEARRRGTGCLCISVGAPTDPAVLRRVFGTAAHAAVPRVDSLPGVVGPLFRAALESAELQRRSWQRRSRTAERLAMERAAS
jgi:hypothetical protein